MSAVGCIALQVALQATLWPSTPKNRVKTTPTVAGVNFNNIELWQIYVLDNVSDNGCALYVRRWCLMWNKKWEVCSTMLHANKIWSGVQWKIWLHTRPSSLASVHKFPAVKTGRQGEFGAGSWRGSNQLQGLASKGETEEKRGTAELGH
jgi:hypothetical protein